MKEPQEVRRSGRKKIRPVEFWNFVRPEEVSGESIIYNQHELTKRCIYEPFSLTYYNTSSSNSIINEKPKPAAKRGDSTHSAVIGKNSTTNAKQSGRKRKLDSREPSEKDGAQAGSSRDNRVAGKKQRVTRKERPGVNKYAMPNGAVSSPRVAGTKQKLAGREQTEVVNGYASPSEDGGQNQKSRSKESQKQKVDRRTTEKETNECINNRQEDASVALPSNSDHSQGRLINESDCQHTKTVFMEKISLMGRDFTENTTAFEQPSFRNVLSSTAITPVFKVPGLPPLPLPLRKPLSMLKMSSQCVDPSMVAIPEEKEEEEEQDECQAQRGEQNEEEQQEESETHNASWQNQEESAGGRDTATTTSGTSRKCVRSDKNLPVRVQPVSTEGHEQGPGQQSQESHQASLNLRRSSRVRTKPLEFWNFEKVEVERQDDGEVRIIHKKQDSSQHIQARVVDCSAYIRSHPGEGITLSDDLLRDTTEAQTQRNKVRESTTSHARGKHKSKGYPMLSPSWSKWDLINSISPSHCSFKSPIRRKLFSHKDNYLDEPVEESKITKITVGGKTLTVVGTVKFGELQFVVMEKKDYKCYVGHGKQDKNRSMFVTYLFLERGHIIWNTSRKLVVYVIEGHGMLQVMKEEEGTAYTLKPKVTVHCEGASKLCLKKNGRSKMLKLHLCWLNTKASASPRKRVTTKPATPLKNK